MTERIQWYIFWSLALLRALLIVQPVISQVPDTLWTRRYGGPNSDQCNHIEPASDRGWILAGSKGNSLWVIRIDSVGNEIWNRTFSGSGPAVGLFAAETATHGYVAFGIGCLDNVHCGSWSVRLSSTGDSLGRQFLSNGVAETACHTLDSGFVLAGSIQGQQDDFWILKTDANGNPEWSNTYGASGDQEANAICQNSDEGFVLGGQLQHGISRLQRVTSAGGSLWIHTYPANGVSSCRAITQTADSGFVFAGHTEPFVSGSADFLLMKLTTQGDSVWRHTYGNAADEYANNMIPTLDHGYLLAGERQQSGSAWVVKTDSAGTLLWSQTYASEVTAAFYTLAQVADGGYLLGGTADGDWWLVRLAPELVVPYNLTLTCAGDNLILRWEDDSNHFFRIYSRTSLDGVSTLEGSTSNHVFIIPRSLDADSKFYIVVGWDGN